MYKPYYYGSIKETKLKNSTFENKVTKLKPAEWVSKIVRYAQLRNAGLAIWKLPQDNTIHILYDLDGGTRLSEVNLDDLDSGFILAPFQAGTHPNIHFKSDIKGTFSLELFNNSEEESIELSWEKIGSEDENLIIETNIESLHTSLPPVKGVKSTNKEDYINTVRAGIEAIKQEELYKVVPSKVKSISIDGNLNIADAYLKACSKYKDAFVSLTFSSISGLWMGATPEILIEDKKSEYFKTVALAGTQAKTDNNVAHTAWIQKEIEEQALVSRYIINCFKKIRLREYEEIGPKTIQAGSLLHLKTTYKVDTKTLNFPELASVMLKLLHPTSAVCGMPKEKALEFLSVQEQHDRSYFSGFIGPVLMYDQSHIFVNLRCCQFTNNMAIFYAGAGITIDSDPEKEWLETEMKCKVLADIVFRT